MAQITTAKINSDFCKIGLPEIASVFLELNYTTHCRSKHQFQTFLVLDSLRASQWRLHTAGDTWLNLQFATERWAIKQVSETPFRLSDDQLVTAALQVLARTRRSCTVTDQSLLSVRVRRTMEEKKLRPCGVPINMGAWFLWTISIWS